MRSVRFSSTGLRAVAGLAVCAAVAAYAPDAAAKFFGITIAGCQIGVDVSVGIKKGISVQWRGKDCLVNKINTATRKLRELTTGTISQLIAAFRKGANGLLDFARRKFGNRAVEWAKKLVSTLPPIGPILKLGRVATAIATQCRSARPPQCILRAIVSQLPPPLPKVVQALTGPGNLRTKIKNAAQALLSGLPKPIPDIVKSLLGPGGWKEKMKKIGDAVLALLKSAIDSAKKKLKAAIDKVFKPVVNKVRDFIVKTVIRPAAQGLSSIVRRGLDAVVERVAAAILGRTEKMRGQADALIAALDSMAAGNFSAVNAKLAAYNTNLDSVGRDATKLALEYGLEFVRGKAVAFVLKKVEGLMKKVWQWAWVPVSAAQKAIVGAVGTIPIAGGVLAAAAATLIELGWNTLKGKVEQFIEDQVNKIADIAMARAREALSGPAARAGGALQAIVNAIKGPLQSIAQKVQAKIKPVLDRYRSVVARLKKVRDRMQASRGLAPATTDDSGEDSGGSDTGADSGADSGGDTGETSADPGGGR